MKQIILTGAPGSGKSSIVLAMELQGEYVVREAAEDYIRLRQAQGQLQPWTEPDFQEKILSLQIARTHQARQYNAERVIFDRGILDGLAYSPDRATKDLIDKLSKNQNYCSHKVFLVDRLGTTETTEVRREDNEQAAALEQKLEQIYKEYGYEPIRIPAGPLAQRVAMMREYLD